MKAESLAAHLWPSGEVNGKLEGHRYLRVKVSGWIPSAGVWEVQVPHDLHSKIP